MATDVGAARQAKADCEKKIQAAIGEFERLTGCKVKGVGLAHEDRQDAEGVAHVRTTGVSLSVEL